MTMPLADPDDIARAVRALRAGGVVAFPTETVFGLGAAISRPDGVRLVFDLKRRPLSQPLPALVSSAEMAHPLVAEWPARADAMARRHWPGPLTLVLAKSPLVPDVVTAGGRTIALRCPAHPVALALIEALGEAVAATSANLHRGAPALAADEVRRVFPHELVTVLDGPPPPAGLPSTILFLGATPGDDRILREGPIAPADLGHD